MVGLVFALYVESQKQMGTVKCITNYSAPPSLNGISIRVEDLIPGNVLKFA